MILLDGIGQDVRYAARTLRRSPVFALAAVISLALAIGATSGTFAVVNAVLLRSMPWGNADHLYLLQRIDPQAGSGSGAWSYPRLQDVRRNAPASIEAVAGFAERRVALSLDAGLGARRVVGEFVSENYFSVVGVSPLRGRGFQTGGNGQSDVNVALLSARLANDAFGGEGRVLGHTIRVNGIALVIIGIMPDGFGGLSGEGDVWMPIAAAPTILGRPDALSQFYWGYSIAVRMRQQLPAAANRTAVQSLTEALRLYGGAARGPVQLRFVLARDRVVEPGVESVLLILLGASCCVLLLTCANIASLSITRMTARYKEMAVKAALGATPYRLSRHLATESAVLALLGGTIGLLLSIWATHVLWTLRPTAGSTWVRALADVPAPSLNGNVVAFAVLVTIVAGVLLGAIPWFGAQRMVATGRLHLGTGDHAPGHDARYVRSLRQVLAAGQVALAFALVTGAVLLVVSLENLANASYGFVAPNVLTFRLDVPAATYDAARAKGLYDALLERLSAIQGVARATLDNTVPLHGTTARSAATIDAALPVGNGGRGTPVRYHAIGEGYFHVLGIHVLRGRGITKADGDASMAVAVINQEAADRFWNGLNPVGRQIESLLFDGLSNKWGPARVIGVVANVQYGNPGEQAEPDVYVSLRRDPPPTAFVLVQAARDPMALVPLVRRVVHDLDPDLAVDDMMTMRDRVHGSSAVTRFSALVIGLYAVVAFVIAIVGIYSIIAFGVIRRRHEFGIRMALGERQSSIMTHVVLDSAKIITVGTLFGLLGSVVVHQMLRHQLFDVGATDPRYDIVVLLAFVAVGLAASLLPALAVTRIDPVAALREE